MISRGVNIDHGTAIEQICSQYVLMISVKVRNPSYNFFMQMIYEKHKNL
jgi:hypothetical protein